MESQSDRLRELFVVKIGPRVKSIAIIKAVDAHTAEKCAEMRMGREAGPFVAKPLDELMLSAIARVNGRDARSILRDFENIPVAISAYTDGDAIDDGVLVELGPKDRCTRAVWDYLIAHAPLAEPPEGWPMRPVAPELRCAKCQRTMKGSTPYDGACACGGLIESTLTETVLALAMAMGAAGMFAERAQEIYGKNIKGGIWTGQIKLRADGTIGALVPESDTCKDEDRLWILPNERKGVTLMFPRDY